MIRDLRVELTLVAVLFLGLLFMALGPAVSDRFRQRFGLGWLLVVYGYLSLLVVRSIRMLLARPSRLH